MTCFIQSIAGLFRHGLSNVVLTCLLGLAAGTCTGQTSARGFIILQSTTSTQNSGLLRNILPQFTAISGIEVRVIAVGTGQAIRNARNGDGDVLLVHARSAEEQFVAEGHGIERFDLMYNDFVIVGPAADPARIHGGTDPLVALRAIARARAAFASRGDNSGTHHKENELWTEARYNPLPESGTWYRETGSGMGATLNLATAMAAYTLTDRATWISFRNKGDMVVHVQGDPRLFNQYGITAVNPVRHPSVNTDAARRFVDWMLGPNGQQAIANYRVQSQQLFFPNARSP